MSRKRLKQPVTDRPSPLKDEIFTKMKDDITNKNNELSFVYVSKKKIKTTPTKPFHFANSVKLMPLVVQPD